MSIHTTVSLLPNPEQPAYRQTGFGELTHQCCRGDQVEPVAEQADDLTHPQGTVIPVALDEGEIPNRYRLVLYGFSHR